LNVFPIAVPPLRERAEDIPLLVEYFVGRFANGAGKNIRYIGKHTLEELKGYHWPGNIRELQNVVEGAVILSETDTFVVDESWLKRDSADSSPHKGLSTLADREVEMIEAALAESHGRSLILSSSLQGFVRNSFLGLTCTNTYLQSTWPENALLVEMPAPTRGRRARTPPLANYARVTP